VLRWSAPEQLPRLDEIAIGPAVLFFAVTISLLSGVVFGLVPVLRFRAPTAVALRDSARGASEAPGRLRTRHALVVTQVALALVLLTVSGLMIRSFVAMRQVHPGFTRPAEVQTFQVTVPADATDQRFARTHEQMAQELARVPGVTSVGLSSSITMDGEDNANPLWVDGVEVPSGQLPPLRRFKTVGPGYFETMGTAVVAGRVITWADIYQLNPVVVISERLAREYWLAPSAAIGKRVRGARPTWYEVVGVVGQERDDGLDQPPTAIVYWPMLNGVYSRDTLSYAVRSPRVGSPGFLAELRHAVWSVDPHLPLAGARTLDEIRADSMAQTSFAMVMLAIAGIGALLLGAVGIYGVMAYVAAQRMREIGIRMALGAQAADVRRLVLGEGLRLAVLGIVLGLAVAAGVTRAMGTLLYATSPTDPLTFACVVPLLLAAALLACWVPARRAMRADPIAALRCD
jgi:putative ABC transport system permease protein